MTAETIGPTGRNRLRYAVPGERHRARAAQHDGRNRLAVRPRKAPPCRSFRAEHGRATHLTTETVRSTGTERLRCAVSAKRHWSPKRHVSVRGTVGRPAATGSLCVLESGRGPERLAITHKPSAVRPRRIPLCRFWRVAAPKNSRKTEPGATGAWPGLRCTPRRVGLHYEARHGYSETAISHRSIRRGRRLG